MYLHFRVPSTLSVPENPELPLDNSSTTVPCSTNELAELLGNATIDRSCNVTSAEIIGIIPPPQVLQSQLQMPIDKVTGITDSSMDYSTQDGDNSSQEKLINETIEKSEAEDLQTDSPTRTTTESMLNDSPQSSKEEQLEGILSQEETKKEAENDDKQEEELESSSTPRGKLSTHTTQQMMDKGSTESPEITTKLITQLPVDKIREETSRKVLEKENSRPLEISATTECQEIGIENSTSTTLEPNKSIIVTSTGPMTTSAIREPLFAERPSTVVYEVTRDSVLTSTPRTVFTRDPFPPRTTPRYGKELVTETALPPMEWAPQVALAEISPSSPTIKHESRNGKSKATSLQWINLWLYAAVLITGVNRYL